MLLRRCLLLALLSICCVASAEDVKVKITTTLGDIVISLDTERAPMTVANFLTYVEEGAYDETIFHRVIPGFMVQGGGLYMDLSEAPEKDPVTSEADNGLKNIRGTVAMARFDDIDSATRQFFINVDENPSLDHGPDSFTRETQAKAEEMKARGIYKPMTCRTFGYTVFGKVESGMDVVDLIEVVDTHVVGPHDDVPINPIIVLTMERLQDGS